MLFYNRHMNQRDRDDGVPVPEGKNSVDTIIEMYRQSVDETLIRENLTRSYEERILRLQELQRFADELERAGKALRET